MAIYTTSVRSICESVAGNDASKGGDDVEKIITSAAPKIFGTNWPIFDENYRLTLEKLILRHYYTREICEETVGLWKLRVVDKLNLIMPYYNKLYESELLVYNPLHDTDYTTSGNRKGNTKSDGAANTTQTANTSSTNTQHSEQSFDRNVDDSQWELYSDTPQGGVKGIVNAEGSVGDDSYLTYAKHDTDVMKEDTTTTTDSNGSANGSTNTTADSTTTNKIDTLEDYVEHVSGKRGITSYSKLLKEFRDTFLNINMRIVDEFSDLFIALWE